MKIIFFLLSNKQENYVQIYHCSWAKFCRVSFDTCTCGIASGSSRSERGYSSRMLLHAFSAVFLDRQRTVHVDLYSARISSNNVHNDRADVKRFLETITTDLVVDLIQILTGGMEKTLWPFEVQAGIWNEFCANHHKSACMLGRYFPAGEYYHRLPMLRHMFRDHSVRSKLQV